MIRIIDVTTQFLHFYIYSSTVCLGESQIQKRMDEIMKKNNLRNFSVASILLILFILWTLAIKYVDV